LDNQNEEIQKQVEYNKYLSSLKAKSKNAISITEKKDNLIFLGVYAEDYPEIHLTEIYEDENSKVYKLDKN